MATKRPAMRFLYRRLCSDSSRRERPYFPSEVYKYEHDESKMLPEPQITKEMVEHLERLSLVQFTDRQAVEHLKKAIRCAVNVS